MAIPFANPTEDTILDIIQEAAEGIKQTKPATLNSASKDIQQWIRAANFAGRDIRRRFLWPALRKRFYFTSTGVTLVELPEDLDRTAFDTFYNSSQYRSMLGPLTEREWEARKSAISNVTSTLKWRFCGTKTRQMEFIEAPPTGDVIVFQYASTNWILPTLTWSAGVSVTAGEYCEYLGNVYKAAGSGVTGATPPTHMVGSASDDVITWTRALYEKVVEDGAVPILDRNLLILGIQKEWREKNGFEFEGLDAAFRRELNRQIGALAGARSFLAGSNADDSWLISARDIPDTGYCGET